MMKCKLTAAALLLTLMLTAVSCGSDTTDTTDTTGTTGPADTVITTEAEEPLDLQTLAKTLSEACTFSEALAQNDAYLQNHLYGFMSLSEQITSCTAYVPSGITPEEILVFEMKSADDTAALTTMLNSYVSYQISQYSDYAPAQVPKLEDPVILTHDNMVVYIISEDNSAAASTAKNLLG